MDGGGVQYQQAVLTSGIQAAASATDMPTVCDLDELNPLLQGIHAVALGRSIAAPHHFSALVRQCMHLISIKQGEILQQIEFLEVRQQITASVSLCSRFAILSVAATFLNLCSSFLGTCRARKNDVVSVLK